MRSNSIPGLYCYCTKQTNTHTKKTVLFTKFVFAYFSSPNILNASGPPLLDLLVSHLPVEKKTDSINQNPENPLCFFSAMPLCSPCPIEQNTLALAPSVMRPRARADGPWGKQTRPLVQTHLRDLGLEGGMKGGCYKCHAQKAEVERGAAVRGSSCFRFHCRSKSNSRLWRSAEVNDHCHDPMALSSKKNPSV